MGYGTVAAPNLYTMPKPRALFASQTYDRESPYRASFIADQLWDQVGTRFTVYYTDTMNPTDQREIVTYRTTRKGQVRRSTMSNNHGKQLRSQAELRARMQADLAEYASLYFTFVSKPQFGLTAHDDDDERAYLDRYQVVFPEPIARIH